MQEVTKYCFKVILFGFFFASSLTNLIAQKQANIWYFGLMAGLDFNSGSPIVISGGQINTREGCATICDKNTGTLLFYTDGETVWNKNHQIMPNGSGLLGDYSSTQSAVCIPNPGNNNRYYLFTTALSNGFRYSEVDMLLDGGLGNVITGTKNTLLVSNSSEKLIATQNYNGEDYWVITHQNTGNAYYVYSITSGGISAPSVFNIGFSFGGGSGWNGTGYLKFSPDGKKLANASGPQNAGGLTSVEIFDFDNPTGVLSGPNITLSNLSFPYGVEFSNCNGQFLYVTETVGKRLLQYNLLAGNQAAIEASKVILATAYNYGALQLGANNKIYVAKENGFNIGVDYLGVINNPNNSGAGCNFVENGINLGGNKTLIGLPTFASNFFKPTINLGSDTSLCNGDSLILDAGNTGSSYLWSTNDTTQTIVVNNNGTYWVQVISGSCIGNDTVQVYFNTKPSVNLGNDTILCEIDSLILNAGNAGATYLWSSGDTTQNILVDSTGDYWVLVSDSSSCSNRDTINVTFTTPPALNIGNDTSLCQGAILQIEVTTSGATYLWSTGAVSPFINISNQGIYTVTVTLGSCKTTDSISVSFTALPSIVAYQDTTINKGQSVQLEVAGGIFISYNWLPSSTLNNSNIANPQATPQETTVYYVTVIDSNSCEATDSVIVKVMEEEPVIFIPNAFTPDNKEGYNNVFIPVGIGIENGFQMFIYNRWGDMIYETTDVDKPWDGRANEGKDIAQQDVYVWLVYVMDNLGKKHQYVGHVTLIR